MVQFVVCMHEAIVNTYVCMSIRRFRNKKGTDSGIGTKNNSQLAKRNMLEVPHGTEKYKRSTVMSSAAEFFKHEILVTTLQKHRILRNMDKSGLLVMCFAGMLHLHHNAVGL